MNQDSRGVQRGRCQTCGCDGYDRGSEGKKCVKCGHPPGKHENLDRDVTQSTGSTSFQHGQNPSGDQIYSGYVHVHVPAPQLHLNLPVCQANGCGKAVWYDHALQQVFSYCSPECRDGHLLSDQKQKLKDDLDGLKAELQHVVAQEIGLRQTHQQTPPSPKQAATPPTGSSDGVGRTQQQSPSTGSSDGIRQTQQQLASTGSSDGGGQTQQQSPPPSSPEQTPPPPTVVSDTGSSSSAATSSKKGKKKQKVVMVDIEKIPRKNSGLILSKRPYVTDDAKVVGFIVVGVVRVKAVYSFFQDDKIKMCDVIETVNNKPCQELNYPGKDLQEAFEQHIADRSLVSLQLNHCIALPPVSSALSHANKKGVFYTHVITLMYTKESDNSHYGLTLNDEFVVEGVSKDSPAKLSRMKFDDRICMYVTDKAKGQLVSEKKLILQDLEKAHSAGRNVILFIVRSNVNEI